MREWTSITITTNKQANNMLALFKETHPEIGATDTETDGLHIIQSTPFVVQFGWLHPTLPKGYTFLVDFETHPILAYMVIQAWYNLAKELKLLAGHNIKFDLHMMANKGLPYPHDNLTDSMFFIRYGHDNLTVKHGGPPLGLKEYATRYIDRGAKQHEQLLNKEKSAIASILNNKLRVRLAPHGRPPSKYKAATYTLGVLEQIFSDPLATPEDVFTGDLWIAYTDWLREDVPTPIRERLFNIVESDMIPYNMLDRKTLYRYAHYDIIYTLEAIDQLLPVVQARQNWYGIELENQLIRPLFEMERVGFKADKQYLLEARDKLKAYIIERRNLLATLTGRTFSIGQVAVVKEVLTATGITIESTKDEIIDKIKTDLIHTDPEHPAIKIIALIQELRTLEKWYSTYVLRFIKDLTKTDRLYTTINQVGTVSGRVTSDFQQFPSSAIVAEDETELFHPRRVVLKTGGEYTGICYLDFSQIELRFQALYTILVGHPDLNLCRAYMPYKCVNKDGVLFDPYNREHVVNWDKDWYLEEDPTQHWVATDVHAATTIEATGLTPADPDFKKLRSKIGKRVNFAKNYGAKKRKIATMFPEYTDEEITRIDGAYYKAFPGIMEYHKYCEDRAKHYSNTQNIFGIRYYGVNGHKLINMLIQGGSAYYLKLKIIELYKYWKANNVKSRWQMQIHDELSWEVHKDDDPKIFFEFQRIMQDWPDTLVPIVAEMEVTTTCWAEKKGVHTADELQVYLSN